jgi:hypothetical protein
MSIKVAVRARPFSLDETNSKAACVLTMNGPLVEVHEDGPGQGKPSHQFAFDHAFWSVNGVVPGNKNPLASQKTVYDAIGVPVVGHVLTGYNACLFAYGQTGSGKTYSMMGTPGADTNGIIPRFAGNIFAEAAKLSKKGVQVCVELSYFEIYCEKVRCLLNPAADGHFASLRVREHPVTGPYVDGLARMAIKTEEEFLQLMQDGSQVRITAATDMNAQSSRSHAVCTVYVTQKTVEGPVTRSKVSKLNLVDLAGSERADKTHATGTRLVEGSNINKSLSALGMVISNLSEMFEQGGKARHIPYRDSILTWILKDNLGGNSQTVMLATISPAMDQVEETLSTLRYAERAKKIVNKAVINESNDNQVIADLQAQIAALKSQMATTTNAAERLDLKEAMEASEAAMADMRLTFTEKLAAAEVVLQEREAKMAQLLHEKEQHITRLNSELRHVKGDLEERDEQIRLLRKKLEDHEKKVKAARAEEDEAEALRAQIEALESRGRPAQKKVAGQVSVKALAKAYERMGKDGRPVPEVRYTKFNLQKDQKLMNELGITDKQKAGGDATKGEGEEELELELDEELELDLGDDEINLDEELELDLEDDAPKEEGGEDEIELDEELELDLEEGDKPPAGAQDDSLLNLDVDELELDEEPTPQKPAEQQQGVGMDASALQDDELELDDEEAPEAPKNATSDVEAPSPAKDPQARPEQRARAFTVNASKVTQPAEPQPPAQAPGKALIKSPANVVATLVVPSHALPNNRYLREPFRVVKVDEGALISRTKDRVWDVDFFSRKFNNMDVSGNVSFSMSSAHLFRVEKHWSDSKKLTLYFFDAPHPYELILSSTERRQRMYELAMIQRRNAILWCPSLCPDEDNDAVIQVIGTTIERANGRQVKVKGDAKFMVARMPYEVIDFWFGCFNLQQKPLPSSTDSLSSFIPKGTNEVYVIAVLDVPGSLMGTADLGDFFLAYLGNSYFVLKNTCLESKDKPKKGNNAMVVIVRRSFIVRMSHCEGVELGSIKKANTNAGDFSAVACTMMINETSVCCVAVNATPFMEDNNLRSANIRALVSSLPLGNGALDITTRFDYLLVGGAFGFANAFKADDGMKQQMKNGALMTEFQEGTPNAHMSGLLNPMRILYNVRPRNCRLDVKKYDADPHIRLMNCSVACDLFTQRAFLSTFGEAVPNTMFHFSNMVLKPERVPPITGAELHFIAPWLEGSPLVNPLQKSSDGFVPSGPVLPVKPVVHNFEYLRLQSLCFTLVGIVSTSQEKKKGVIATGSLSLKNNFTLGEPMEFHVSMCYRTCIVGTLSGTLLQVNVGDVAKTASGGPVTTAQHTLVVQCDENQILDEETNSWVPTLYPNGPWDWSDPRNPAKQMRRETNQLPDEKKWKWSTEWKHETRPENKEGWSYATSFTVSDFTFNKSSKARARRRRWTRVMQAEDAITLHNYVKMLNAKSES